MQESISATQTQSAGSVAPTSPVVPPGDSLGDIAAKNFVAGASRALGSIVIYLLFLGVMFVIFSTFIWPRLEPYVTTYTNAMESLQTFQQVGQPGVGQSVDTMQLQDLLEAYQR